MAPLGVGLLGLIGYGLRPDAVESSAAVDIPWLPRTVQVWAPQIHQAALAHDVDAELLAILVLVESRGNPLATSSAGARGLVQLMPSTANDIARQRDLPEPSVYALYQPGLNLDFGAYYLAWLLRRYRGRDDQVELAAAAYNGGPGRVSRWLRGRARLPGETRAYKKKVAALYRERDLPHSLTLSEL